MDSCKSKRQNQTPVFTIDVTETCHSRGRERKSSHSPKMDEVKMMCTEPIPITVIATTSCGDDKGPVGRITKHKDFDIVGGKKVYHCLCEKRHGLQDRCERVSCQNNPGCKMTPPMCWPKYKPKPVEKQEISLPIRMCFRLDNNASH